jgi:hypothetical protein
MDPNWSDFAKQLPIAAAMLWMFVRFLSHLKELEAARQSVDADRNKSITALGDNCHAFQRDLAVANAKVIERVVSVIERNTETLGATHAVTERLTNIIDRFDERLRRIETSSSKRVEQ